MDFFFLATVDAAIVCDLFLVTVGNSKQTDKLIKNEFVWIV